MHAVGEEGHCDECGMTSQLFEVQFTDGGSMWLGSSCVKKYTQATSRDRERFTPSACSDLSPFEKIANECDVEECYEIMRDCEEDSDEFMRGPVRNVYAKRLECLEARQREIDHYEEMYD